MKRYLSNAISYYCDYLIPDEDPLFDLDIKSVKINTVTRNKAAKLLSEFVK